MTKRLTFYDILSSVQRNMLNAGRVIRLYLFANFLASKSLNKISIVLSNIFENNITVILFFLFEQNFGNQYNFS